MNEPYRDQLLADLLIASEQQSEALRSYLEEEEARRKAEEVLNERLREKLDRGMNFAI